MVDEKDNEEIVMVDDDKRSFLGPDETNMYYIIPPDTEDIRGADWNYSKMYTKCLLEGITTAAEMVEILQRRGIIGPEFEQRAMELTEILNERIAALNEATDNDEKTELAINVANAREELFQWNQRLNGPMANTCEQMADDARLEYLTSCMVTDIDGNKLWNSYEGFLQEKDQAFALKARFEVMLYLQGLNSDFLEQTPEAITMKEVRDDLTQKAEEALKIAEAIEKEKQVEEEETVKKKAASKTKTSKAVKKTTKKTTSDKEVKE